MTIESITSRAQTPLTLKTPKKTDTSIGITSIPSVEKNDSVAITTVAQDIKQAVASSSSGSNIDMNKVTALKNALANGSYQINAESIAKKMIQYESLMP
ncbi:MAG: flagellar biosynthesis anti-sigma factor FlgM [Methylococcales bacterium]|nr:flagellar biosynthesis anti-sigma factor FlgM [Methylococcales bacterium]